MESSIGSLLDDGGQVSAEALLALIEAGTPPMILDVRSRVEYQAGHVPGAVHAPFWASPQRVLIPGARAAEPLVIYCGHGPRAQMAAAIFRCYGFSRVKLLDGHMSGWRARGLPVER